MAKYRAIPDGYMTVGEVAKKMGTTVRTLQYYDKEGLLSPSAAALLRMSLNQFLCTAFVTSSILSMWFKS